jgi:galactose mutarotase-like enzyme
MIILKNHCLTAKISSIGAELIELGRNDKNSVLWKMDNLFWNRISPILFPIVGRLLDDSYEHSEQIYRMKQHGFARDLPFRIIEQTQSKVELELTDSDETRLLYPFSFAFFVCYELMDDKIEISFRTKNNSDEKMPYSVGGHPGFAIKTPLSEYRLNFNQTFETERWMIENSYYTGHKEMYKVDQYLNLCDDFFLDDAIVFKHPLFSCVTLENLNAEKIVTVGSSKWEAIGFWTKPNAPFFCIEPWWGWADSHTSTGKIMDKEGLHWLNPEQEETVSYYIQVH